MKPLTTKGAPLVITSAMLVLIYCLQLLLHFAPGQPVAKSLQRIESMSFDWRVQYATKYPRLVGTHFAAVMIDEATVQLLREDGLPEGGTGTVFKATWPYPQHIYGRLLRELAAQGPQIIGLDILLDDIARQDVNPVTMPRSDALQLGFTEAEVAEFPTFLHKIENPGQPDQFIPGITVNSSLYFAAQLRQTRKMVLATDTEQGVFPAPLLNTNAAAIGNISVQKDADGYLRRIKVFTDYRLWHPLIKKAVIQEGYNLSQVQIEPGRILFTKPKATNFVIRLDREGRFRLQDLTGASAGDTEPPLAKPFTVQRIWHMGIVLAARALGLDLDHPQMDLPRGRILLHGPNGLKRVIPVDHEGRMLVDWSLPWGDPRLITLNLGAVLSLDCLRHSPQPSDHAVYLEALRAEGATNLVGNTPFRDKIVVVGSTMVGSNLSDQGPTPLSPATYYFSCHWNVANMLMSGRFVRETPLLAALLLIFFMILITALLNFRLRVMWATFWVAFMVVFHIAAATLLYVYARYWIPIMVPVFGALLTTHVCMVTHRVLIEQKERRRIKSLFSKLVSPNIVNEILEAEHLSLGGARRKVTIFFSDVRGFTEITDLNQATAEDYVQQQGLDGAAADAIYDKQAREVLATVNLYLSIVADTIKQHNGTLDKYIGDCVMAFWGAPTPNEHHALDCVRAAISTQRAIHALNQKRMAENQARTEQNVARAAAGQPPLPMLALLSLGTGINTGVVTVGMMGSDEHLYNYTVFGREVNLASRLEGVSGRGRIFISTATYHELKRDDPALAAHCLEHPPEMLKGIRKPVPIYEVPWQEPEPPVAVSPAPQTSL